MVNAYILDIPTLTESTKKIVNALEEYTHRRINENDSIAYAFEEHEDDGYINLNFTSTPIRFLKSELDIEELKLDGVVQIWATWTFNAK